MIGATIFIAAFAGGHGALAVVAFRSNRRRDAAAREAGGGAK